MKASIIIRTKNEAKRMGDVLSMLSKQTERDFEIIVVDSGSSDKTLDIVDNFKSDLDIKMYKIKPGEFTYPYACNFGAEKASGEFLVYISGHSIPINGKWLELGLKNFDDKNVGGIHGLVLASADASFWEKLLYFPSKFIRHKIIGKRIHMGILGNTNAIIRRDLWQKHHFDESYVKGGEDGEMAKYILNHGYKIILDPAFTVRHSHGFGLVKFVKRYIEWIKMYNRFR